MSRHLKRLKGLTVVSDLWMPDCQQLPVSTMDVSGEADIRLRIGGIMYPRTVVIADLGLMEGILGLDFLEDNQALIDVAAGYIQTVEGQVILH